MSGGPPSNGVRRWGGREAGRHHGGATVRSGAPDVGFSGPSTVDQAIISLGKGDDVVNIGGNKLTLNGPKKSKLAGGSAPITITADLKRGAYGYTPSQPIVAAVGAQSGR